MARAVLESKEELEGAYLAKLAHAQEEARESLIVAEQQTELLEGKVAELQPKATWADQLIGRERGWPLLVPRRAELWHVGHLHDAEPYFDIGIFVEYRGVLRLIVGQQYSGFLSWDGKQFAQQPRVTINPDTALPFDSVGPTLCILQLRQHVTRERAVELLTYLATPKVEMEFWARHFSISLRLETFEGEVIHESHLVGDYLAAEIKNWQPIPENEEPRRQEGP